MKAVIMAGGEGKRLRPLTCDRPKPMVRVVNRPIMEHIIRLLKKHDINDIAVTLQYMAENIKNHFGDGEELDVNMQYFIEKTPLGTAGSVKNAQKFLDETFVVISGDALTDVDLTGVLKYHNAKGALVTIILKRVDVPLEYGVVVMDKERRITNFLEKPNWDEVSSDTVNTGIYILDPSVLTYFEQGEFFDFGKDLFPMLLEKNIPMYGYVTEDYWCDIGDLKAYREAHMDILNGKVYVDIPGNQIAPNVWIGDDVEIDVNSTIKAPCVIGNGVKIKKGVHLEKYSVLGDHNYVGEYSTIKQSILWNNSYLEGNAKLSGCVLLNKVKLRNNVSILEGSIIGEDCLLEDGTIIKPDIKIWPGKKIEEGAVLNESLIWGTKHSKNVFGERGITGNINVKITPEYVSKLGAAYGTLMNGKGRIGIASSDSKVSNMIKMAFKAGLISSGIEVFDFDVLLIPMLRCGIRFYKLDGGVYIGDLGVTRSKLNIEFFNENGCNIDKSLERKIENIYSSEEFFRCEVDNIKKVTNVQGYHNFYIMDIINNLKTNNVNLKIAVNVSSEMVKNLLKQVFDFMNCEVKFIDTRSDFFLEDLEEEKDIFSKFVELGNFDLGVEIDKTGEKLKLVDASGRVIEKDMYQILIAIIQLISTDKKTIIVPFSASMVIEEIANNYGGKVKRTKTATNELMKNMYDENEPDLVSQFEMYFDAISGVVKVLEFMKQNNYTMSQLYDMIPEFYINKIDVECSWNDKGRIIRKLIEDNSDKSIETLEGVKIHMKDGWVLVLPNIERPCVSIISEGFNSEYARELGVEFEDKIKKIIQK